MPGRSRTPWVVHAADVARASRRRRDLVDDRAPLPAVRHPAAQPEQAVPEGPRAAAPAKTGACVRADSCPQPPARAPVPIGRSLLLPSSHVQVLRLGASKFDAKFLDSRRLELDGFLRDVLKFADPERVETLDDFLEYAEHVILGTTKGIEVRRRHGGSDGVTAAHGCSGYHGDTSNCEGAAIDCSKIRAAAREEHAAGRGSGTAGSGGGGGGGQRLGACRVHACTAGRMPAMPCVRSHFLLLRERDLLVVLYTHAHAMRRRRIRVMLPAAAAARTAAAVAMRRQLTSQARLRRQFKSSRYILVRCVCIHMRICMCVCLYVCVVVVVFCACLCLHMCVFVCVFV